MILLPKIWPNLIMSLGSLLECNMESVAPGHDHAGGPHLPVAFLDSLGLVYRAYLELQTALAGDDLVAARASLDRLSGQLSGVDEAALPPGIAAEWRRGRTALHGATIAASNAPDIAATRAAFRDISAAAIELARHVGHGLEDRVVVAHCPMAFDDGADWLQVGENLENPYFGEQMFRCGEITEVLPATGAAGH